MKYKDSTTTVEPTTVTSPGDCCNSPTDAICASDKLLHQSKNFLTSCANRFDRENERLKCNANNPTSHNIESNHKRNDRDLENINPKFLTLLLKRYTKERILFTVTSNKSWKIHSRNYELLGRSHSIRNNQILFELIHWTLGPSPKMFWERFVERSNGSWNIFKMLKVFGFDVESW